MRAHNITKTDLIEFEKVVRHSWEYGEIRKPVHLSGGNEDQLLEIFKEINDDDYIFSTHRNHYHALLAGIRPTDLFSNIVNSLGGSMCVISTAHNFYSSAIVCGTACIAVGVALAIKKRGGTNSVYCFLGDGAVDEGHFYEAVRYAQGHDLPITFVVEDNNRSVTTDVETRWGTSTVWDICYYCDKIRYYEFTPTTPHVGSGKHVSF